MPRPTAALKKIIVERANNLCEYCKSPADYSPQPFSIRELHLNRQNLLNLRTLLLLADLHPPDP